MIPRYRALLAVPIILGAALFTWMIASVRNSGSNRLLEESGEGGPAPQPLPPGLEEVRRLRHQDPAAAAEKCRPFLDSADPAERDAARRLFPEILNALYGRLAHEMKYAQAEKVVQELAAGWPEAQEAEWVRRSWLNDRVKWAVREGEQGRWGEAERLFALVLAGEAPSSGWQHLEAYRDYLLKRRQKALAAGEKAAAEMYLEEAAGVMTGPSAWSPVAAILEERGAAELVARARELAGGRQPAPALAYFNAARRAIERERRWEEYPDFAAAQERCTLDLAAALRDGRVRTVPRSQLLEFWRSVWRSADPGRRLEAAEGALAAGIEEGFAALKAGRHREAEERFQRALREDSLMLWDARCAAPGFDPWEVVPISVQDVLREKLPEGSAAQRLAELRGMVDRGEWTPPHPRLDDVRRALPGLYAEWAEVELREQRVGPAAEKMRAVMRQDPGGEAARRCTAALQRALKDALAGRDVNRIFEVAGFYIAEAGVPPAGDPFRADLRASLAAAATGFRETSPMKRLFMLSLISDCFPGEPDGEAAREEVLASGLEAARRAPVEPAAYVMSVDTGIPGVSAVSVENATEYHILVFYDGPERFFVRLNPLRKGTVVLKDGEYVTGVVVTADHVRPYQGKSEYVGKTYWESYVIETTGGPRDTRTLLGAGASAWGEYRLLRVPEGVKVVVEGKSGMVSAGK